MEKLIERIKQDQEHKVIYLSFEPENWTSSYMKKRALKQVAG